MTQVQVGVVIDNHQIAIITLVQMEVDNTLFRLAVIAHTATYVLKHVFRIKRLFRYVADFTKNGWNQINSCQHLYLEFQ